MNEIMLNNNTRTKQDDLLGSTEGWRNPQQNNNKTFTANLPLAFYGLIL